MTRDDIGCGRGRRLEWKKRDATFTDAVEERASAFVCRPGYCYDSRSSDVALLDSNGILTMPVTVDSVAFAG